jgi:hypothetical protein
MIRAGKVPSVKAIALAQAGTAVGADVAERYDFALFVSEEYQFIAQHHPK